MRNALHLEGPCSLSSVLAVLGSAIVLHDTIINSRSSQKMIHHVCEMSDIFEMFYSVIQ